MDPGRIFLVFTLFVSTSVVVAETLRLSRSLPDGGHYEQCLKLESGQSLGWRFNASQQMSFNVHSHPDDQTVYHFRVDANNDSGAFQPPDSGVYCVMWENHSGQPLDLTGTLTRGSGE